jgi:4-alpha-glucanotransferase
VQAGVPPDLFSANGQRWGNPLYNWARHRASGYAWWVARMRTTLQRFDAVRLDHFIGFVRYWAIPAAHKTARVGRFRPGPGAHFLERLRAELGRLPLVAEDLGLVTPAVTALREQFGLPGMRVLQFAFGDDPKASDYQPHSFPRNCVVYTGTHDNDTTLGWFRSEAGEGTTRTHEQIVAERDLTLRYLNSDGAQLHWDMIRAAQASVADTAIVPMQDVLGLGGAARMNLPGSATGNWRWRMLPGMLTDDMERLLADMTGLYGRAV